MFGRSEFLRRMTASVDASLAAGENRRAAAFLRGPGPGVPEQHGNGPSDGDWVLVVTDRRVLLFSVGSGTRGVVLRESYPVDDVRVVDAALRGTAPSLVLRFPDAVLGWFHALPAWRTETEELIAELGRIVRQAGSGLDAYPDEDRRHRAPPLPGPPPSVN